MHDPKVDPRPGDVAKLPGYYCPRTVRKTDTEHVWYDHRSFPYKGEETGNGYCISIEEWRRWAEWAHVLKVAPDA